MNERTMQDQLKYLFSTHDYKLCNTFIFPWESDFFAISNSGYSVEVEVKVSKADFRRDFTHKEGKHDLFCKRKSLAFISNKYETFGYGMKDCDGKWFQPKYTRITWSIPADNLPNKFFYACPQDLIKADEVPDYAGLIYSNNDYCTIVKKAPFVHKVKRKFTETLLSKYYHRSNELFFKLRDFKYTHQQELTADQLHDLDQIINRFR